MLSSGIYFPNSVLRMPLLMTWAPVFKSLSEAITIIICAVAASAAGAIFFPIEDKNTAEDAENTEEAAK